MAGVVTDWAPQKLFADVNIHGTEKLCRASLEQGIERFVYVSINDVFGIRENIVIDETMSYQNWQEPYPDTKIEASNIVWEYGKKGLPVTIVYPCWVYGPGDRTFIPLLADAIRKRNLVFWRKNVIVWPAYVINVIDLLMVASHHPRAIGGRILLFMMVCQMFLKISLLKLLKNWDPKKYQLIYPTKWRTG